MKPNITYATRYDGAIKVYVGGLYRGLILRDGDKFFYQAKGVSKRWRGELMDSVAAVKRDLEED